MAKLLDGVRLKINPLMLIVMLLCMLYGVTDLVITSFAVVILHELAHTLTARVLGVKVKHIELMPFGGVAQMDEALEKKPAREIVIAFAGPAFNLLLYFLLVAISKYYPLIGTLGNLVMRVTLTIALFNLLPALPLDGGRVLRALLSIPFGRTRATNIACIVSYIIAALLVSVGIWLAVNKTVNATYYIMAAFIAFAAWSEGKKALFSRARELMVKADKLQSGLTVPVRTMAVTSDMTLEQLLVNAESGKVTEYNVYDHRMRCIGRINESQAYDALIKCGAGTAVGSVLKGA